MQFTWLKRFKLRTGIFIALMAGGGVLAYLHYFSGSANATVRYVIAPVARQTLNTIVTGAGQVSGANKIDLKPQGSGIVAFTNVVQGQMVGAGQVVAVLDESNNLVAISQAKAAIETASANYAKILAGATSEDIAVSKAAVDAAKNTLTADQQNAVAVRQQQQLLVSNAYNTLLNSTIALNPGSTNSVGYTTPTVGGTYGGTTAGVYKINIYNSGGGLGFLVSGLETGTGLIPVNPNTQMPLGQLGLYLQFPAGNYHSDDYWTINLPNTRASNYLSNYNSYQNALQTQSQAVASADASVAAAETQVEQAEASLALKEQAAQPADLAVAQAQIDNAKAQLQAAQNNYNANIVAAPFDGQIAALDVQRGDQGGSSVVIATLITQKKLAVVSLNEIDAAKIAAGQPATITFDAVPGLTIKGQVSEIDTIGTVSSGVVTYNVKIAFDSQDRRIRPGMSLTAKIILATNDNVLAVPNAAVQTFGNRHFVQVLNTADTAPAGRSKLIVTSKTPPTRQSVEIGLANDTVTEITGGLNEGDLVVAQTITTATGQAAAAGNAGAGAFRIFGGGGTRGGAGAARGD